MDGTMMIIDMFKDMFETKFGISPRKIGRDR